MSSPPSDREPDAPPSPPYDPEAWRKVRPYSTLKPIAFVRAGELPSTIPTKRSSNALDLGAGASISAQYRSIIGRPSEPSASSSSASSTVCEICDLPIVGSHTQHELSLAHQASLPHSHPPHPLPRSSVGLKILEESGWDPDARVGLGKEGEGRRYPIKVARKDDRVGVGGVLKEKVAKEVVKKQGVREIRKREKETKRRREKLLGEIAGSIDWGVMNGDDGGDLGLK